ncbi:MAG: hypothetical protein JWO46_1704 [Nocardioidaceae bacterium]|nr:hypothetical protein [Nocardioidaceae bacterium]
MLAGLAALSVRQAAFGVFLVVLLASVPFGGMRAASAPKVTVLKKDKAITAAPFKLEYKGAWQTDDIGDLSATPKLKDGSHYLIVAALVSTKAESSVPYSTLREAIRLVGVHGLTRQGAFDPRVVKDSRTSNPDSILVDGDFHTMGDLPPRLTYGLYWVWVLKPGHPVPAKLTVMLQSTTYRKSSLDETMGYFDPVEEARGTFPVDVWETLQTSKVDVAGDG